MAAANARHRDRRDVEDPGARLSSDSKYREVDLAIDWNEEVSLTIDDAERAVAPIRKTGINAVRSSVTSTSGRRTSTSCPRACRSSQVLHADSTDLAPYVYVGDALNDAPMFGGFPNSVGVANIKTYWDELTDKPAFLTELPEGPGCASSSSTCWRFAAASA